MKVSRLDIPIRSDIKLVISSDGNALYWEEGASEHGEAPWQLEEGKEYDYELVDSTAGKDVGWTLEGQSNIVSQNSLHRYQGKISTGIYVGTLTVKARCTKTQEEIPVHLEIRSSKMNYRTDYQKMLHDITQWYTDLVMQQGSPITHKFEVDFDASSQTLYQKFAFVKSIIEDDTFDESMHKILLNPIRAWTETSIEKKIESVRRISRNGLRQIASRTDRVPVANAPYGLKSLPRMLTVPYKKDTLNTPENQFVKYVLTTFYSFCTSLSSKKNATEQLRREIEGVCNKLASYMHNSFFRDVSFPSTLNIGSPALQRKEGYREILQAWLMFDLAAKIAWDGGDNVYDAGKKNIAVLYEYWLFFVLIDVVGKIFSIKPESKEKMVKATSDGIDLQIKQGRMIVLNGSFYEQLRLLNVRLYYNRTFYHTDDKANAGSWSLDMRPDYTLSIWPGEITEAKAEEEDIIVHIHFDAKYRLDKLVFNEKVDSKDKEENEIAQNNEFALEKENREKDIYKKGDILKMHAYKDAIRRTAGAYVLYPGKDKDSAERMRGFHEVIPGLGAFCITPQDVEKDSRDLEKFIRDVVGNFLNRTNQWEKMAVASHAIHKEKNPPKFGKPFPEPYDGEGGLFPDTTPILVGCFKSREHLQWIRTYGLYNLMLENPQDSGFSMDEKFLSCKYVILYDIHDMASHVILKVMDRYPSIMTSDMLQGKGYPDPTPGQTYLVYKVSEDAVEEQLRGGGWLMDGVVTKPGKAEVVYYTNLFSEDAL